MWHAIKTESLMAVLKNGLRPSILDQNLNQGYYSSQQFNLSLDNPFQKGIIFSDMLDKALENTQFD